MFYDQLEIVSNHILVHVPKDQNELTGEVANREKVVSDFSINTDNNVLCLAVNSIQETHQVLQILKDNENGIKEIKRYDADLTFFDEGRYRETLSKFKNNKLYEGDAWKDLHNYADQALSKIEREVESSNVNLQFSKGGSSQTKFDCNKLIFELKDKISQLKKREIKSNFHDLFKSEINEKAIRV